MLSHKKTKLLLLISAVVVTKYIESIIEHKKGPVLKDLFAKLCLRSTFMILMSFSIKFLANPSKFQPKVNQKILKETMTLSALGFCINMARFLFSSYFYSILSVLLQVYHIPVFKIDQEMYLNDKNIRNVFTFNAAKVLAFLSLIICFIKKATPFSFVLLALYMVLLIVKRNSENHLLERYECNQARYRNELLTSNFLVHLVLVFFCINHLSLKLIMASFFNSLSTIFFTELIDFAYKYFNNESLVKLNKGIKIMKIILACINNREGISPLQFFLISLISASIYFEEKFDKGILLQKEN